MEATKTPPVGDEGQPDVLEVARQRWPDNPPWSHGTRLWVFTFVVLVLVFTWWNVRQYTGPVVLACLLTYILHPIIGRVQRHLRLSRATATLAVYSGLAVVVAIAAYLLTRAAVLGLATIDPQQILADTLAGVRQVLPPRLPILGDQISLVNAYEQIQTEVTRLAATNLGPDSLRLLLGLASTFASSFAANMAFMALGLLVAFFTSLYLSLDGEHLLAYFEGKAPRPYRQVFRALQREVDAVWQDFFRGELVLAVVVGLATTLGLLVLGVRYAVTLGLIAGVLEVVPRLGPVLAALPAIAVALVHPSATMPGLPPLALALLVAGLHIAIQLLENNILVPRILGHSVNLPPAVMLVGALAGAAMAGIVGLLLAAPVLGTIRVLGSWLYYQITRPEQATVPVEIEDEDT